MLLSAKILGGLYMSYVYLIDYHPSNSNLKIHDVGVIESMYEEEYNVKFLRENICEITPVSHLHEFDISLTGDDYDYKVCDRCFRHLSTSEQFENNRIKKGGIITKRPSCRDCRKMKNGISISSKDREHWNKLKPKDYTSFSCPICRKTTIAGISKIVLDHCHHTGKVRGWLCESCNTGIGRFDDDPNIVYQAIEWLMKED